MCTNLANVAKTTVAPLPPSKPAQLPLTHTKRATPLLFFSRSHRMLIEKLVQQLEKLNEKLCENIEESVLNTHEIYMIYDIAEDLTGSYIKSE